MIEDISLRAATEADYEFGYQLKKSALGLYIGETWGWNENQQQDHYRRKFSVHYAYVIMLRDTRVGWLVNRRTPEGQELNQVYILPEYQSRGIGTKIIREIVTEAEYQALPVLLQVMKRNHRAKGLYDRLGFKVYGETDTHFLMRKGVPQGVGD